MIQTSSSRLDAFTDAAFAFAVTLLVIGGGAAPRSYDALVQVLAEIPAFAFGFALISVFWFAHVRWRRFRGDGDWRSVVLTFVLVFLVLVYVQPLRAMATATSAFVTGRGAFGGSLSGLFAIYGTGFVAMSAAIAALFADARRNPLLDDGHRITLRGEIGVWLILAATGAVSVLIAQSRFAFFAPWAYMTLPLTVGVFTARFDWGGKRAAAKA